MLAGMGVSRGFTVRMGCLGDLDGRDVMLYLVCARRFVCLLVGRQLVVCCGVRLLPLSKICVRRGRAAEYCLHVEFARGSMLRRCRRGDGLIPRVLGRHTENGMKRASGSSDRCNVLQHSWLTTHKNLALVARLLTVWYVGYLES